MRPLLTSARALKELATGLAPEAVATSTVLFCAEAGGFDVLVAADDSEDTQRVLLIRDENVAERYVPEHLSGHRRDVLSRMASFVERARTPGPLALPRGWRQYKHNNLIAFFAVPGNNGPATRWIAEVRPGERADVIFWTATTSSASGSLQAFEESGRKTAVTTEGAWLSALRAAGEHFHRPRRTDSSDVEMQLAALEPSTTKGWSYEQWLETISDDQRAFIEAPTSKSIRLRGPAGSGKTLAITMKAIREVLGARDAGVEARVVVVTHSWGLAAEISESIDSMGVGLSNEIDVFPLLEIAQNISPHYVQNAPGFNVIGDDSYSGKQAQLDEIVELLEEFVAGDWVTFKGTVSEAFRSRFDSTERGDRLALAWDLLLEFGSVIGAAAIFPGAGSELRYFQLPRASWMLPLAGREEMRIVYYLYSQYMENLDARSLVTSDQVLADFLSHLETHSWNRTRKTQGYDLIFVDEFHLFSPLERQVIHYLTRDVTTYPRVFMAVDPRQSPSEAFIGLAADETRSSDAAPADDAFGDVTNFELTSVHRFTPEILALIKHIHLEFPTLDLGRDWDIDFRAVESAQEQGPPPRLVSAASRAGEATDIARAIQDLYQHGRVALAVVDSRRWRRFSELASEIGRSGKFHVSTVTGRADIEGLGYRRRGVVVGPAEYLAGLQFDSVLVAGIPDFPSVAPTTSERTRFLSLLYLALSRAQREVRIFVNEDDGGAPEVLRRATRNGVLQAVKGSLV